MGRSLAYEFLRKLSAAVGTVFIISRNASAAIGTIVCFAYVGIIYFHRVLRFLPETSVQRIRFFGFVYDIKFGIAVFSRCIFEIIYGIPYSYDDEQYTEQRHGRKYTSDEKCPYQSEEHCDYTDNTGRKGRCSASFDLFQAVSPPLPRMILLFI